MDLRDHHEPFGSGRGGTARTYVGRSDGILAQYALEADGSLRLIGEVAAGNFPAFAAMAPSGRFLYLVEEPGGRVAALAVDQQTGAPTVVNDVAADGASPTYVLFDLTGRWAFVANYESGTVGVFAIGAEGAVGESPRIVSAGRNAHAINVDPTNRWVLVPCKGDDWIAVYAFDVVTGALAPAAVPTVATASGAGPRHLAFDREGARVYLVNELDSTLDVYAFDASDGSLTRRQTLSVVPTGFTGTNLVGEVALDPGGRFVYASNRGHDSIAMFAIEGDGRLDALGHALLGARTPRSFALDERGEYLIAGALESDMIVRFRVGDDGRLTRLGVTPCPSPYYVGSFGGSRGRE